jgi:DNA polymerase-1
VTDSCHSQCRSGCPCPGPEVVSRHDNAEVAIVLDWPSEQESKADEWLVGKRGGASELLRTLLLHYESDLEKLYICSAVNCRPNPKKKAMQKKAMTACRERLVNELREAGVKKVLCVGPLGYGALTTSKALPAITKVRGRWKKAFGMDVIATLPPGFAIGEPEYFRDLAYDVHKFFTTDGLQPTPNVDLWVPETLEEVDEAFEFLYAGHSFVAMDLETTGFSPISEVPLAVGLGVLEGPTDATVVALSETMLESKKVWRRIEKLLNGPIETVFHNAKFDLQHLKQQLLEHGLKYEPQAIHDTMMLNYALDERPMGKYKCHGLEAIARIRYDAPDYGIKMGEFLKEWETATSEHREEMRLKMHTYMALDVYYTARLFPDLYNECLDEDEDLLELYDRLFIPGVLALANVEHHGILLDRPMYEKSRQELGLKADVILKRIRQATDNPEFNPGSPVQVKKFVYDELGLTIDAGLAAAVAQITDVSSRKEGIRSRGTYTDPSRLKVSATAAPVLKMIARGHPEHRQLLDDICEWRNLSKNAGTYINGLLQRCDVDGRVRATLNIHGTASGRLSSTNPNLQNLPPASHTGIAVRSGFLAPPGYSFLDCDYKQLEVRMAGEMSHDPAMKELFESGGDPHAETSKIIYGRSDVSHYERMLGKILTFGLLYGRSPNSIATGPEAEDIVARGGKRWGPRDVHEFFDNLLSNWAVYAKWRQGCREAPYKDGEIKFSIGRKRRFHFVPKHDGGHMGRQGINTPCQGTASDFCLYALIKLDEVLRPYRAQVVATVHDSLLVECHDDDLEAVVPIVIEVMERDTLWKTYIPLKVDLKITKRWGQDDDEQYAGTSSADDSLELLEASLREHADD